MNTQRLKDLRKDKHHMTQAEAAKRLGIALTTYASYEQGHRQPDPDMLAKIATIFDTSVDYIIGTGSGATSDDDGPKLVIADDYIKVYGEIHAGEAAWAEQDIIGRIPITKEMVMRYGRSNLFALRVVGESMNQKIPAGFYAVFCKDKEPEPGEIVAVLIDHEDATVKQYQRTSQAVIFSPMSYDPRFQPYVFRKDEEQDFEILGTYLFSTDQEI